jgi:hypothetical protein
VYDALKQEGSRMASESEIRAACARFIGARDEAEAGRIPWRRLADFFTEDAACIDPVWGQILGTKPDGSHWVVPGLSILYDARDGLFCREHQMLNMAHLTEVMREMRWRPPAELNAPPKNPNRGVSLPRAWAHLETDHARSAGGA